MNDCIFCKIVKGEIPCYKIFENEFTLAFLDISNDSFGHTLIIPKEHYENILDCPQTILDEVMKTTQLVSKHYVDDCGFDGVNILNANGSAAEQSVFHLHFHILPRIKNDGQKAFPNLLKNTDSLEKIAIKLKVLGK